MGNGEKGKEREGKGREGKGKGRKRKGREEGERRERGEFLCVTATRVVLCFVPAWECTAVTLSFQKKNYNELEVATGTIRRAWARPSFCENPINKRVRVAGELTFKVHGFGVEIQSVNGPIIEVGVSCTYGDVLVSGPYVCF